MADQISIAKQVSIRESGFDEYWLQDQIYENPAILGFGELEAIDKERQQSSGGRLDILLKNPEDDSMYEVEVMLGETDESHIIRTIEYWDNEKRRWPQRQHTAVLVAEKINRRFFNVIHLLSHSIPIVAIQVSMLENLGKMSLYFSTVLDTYEEVDDGSSIEGKEYNRDYWTKRAKWTLEAADAVFQATQSSSKTASLSYLKYYIAIILNGKNTIWLHKRSGNKSLLTFRVSGSKQDEVAEILDSKSISYVKKSNAFTITTDAEMISAHQDLISKLPSFSQKDRGVDG